MAVLWSFWSFRSFWGRLGAGSEPGPFGAAKMELLALWGPFWAAKMAFQAFGAAKMELLALWGPFWAAKMHFLALLGSRNAFRCSKNGPWERLGLQEWPP